MNGYLKLAEQFLISRVISGDFPVTNKTKARMGLGALSGLLIFLGLIFLATAYYIWLMDEFTPEIAMTILGLSLTFLGAMSALFAQMLMKHKNKRRKQFEMQIEQALIETLELINSEVEKPIRDNPKTAIALAALIGGIIGQRGF
ncbi:MAG: hypothetical protein VYC19_12035 [Pseudomonadota bacterium]|jgi:hypothetical protein|nr:hypothetical protein [Pseudomonadota bacterium]MEC7703470.1 hypothetical protein [Pseudomonadota bacterium]MEC9236250.1 hypothetical protein [Pseudomonadota bacterium]